MSIALHRDTVPAAVSMAGSTVIVVAAAIATAMTVLVIVAPPDVDGGPRGPFGVFPLW